MPQSLFDDIFAHVREPWTVLDSRFRIQDTGFQYLSVELGFWIPIVSEIPDSTTKDSGFHKQKFPIFRNPDFLTWSEYLRKEKKYIRWAKGVCVLISRDIENQIRIEVSHVNIRIGKQVAPFLHEIDCLQSRVSCGTSTNKMVQNPVLNCFSHRFDYPFIKNPVQYLWCHSCYFVAFFRCLASDHGPPWRNSNCHRMDKKNNEKGKLVKSHPLIPHNTQEPQNVQY